MPHVTIAGDRVGSYVIREERPDGILILQPEADTAFLAELRQRGSRLATSAEFKAWADEHGPLQPADGEG